MPCAAGTIIGTIARANSTQMGFSGAMVLPPGHAAALHGASEIVEVFLTPGSNRNRAVDPMYIGERWLRNAAEVGGSRYMLPVFSSRSRVVR